jgi:formate dehydrogenase iron-sulfur subunit
MTQITKLIDVSKCTGCRGCQLACKQWNQQPAKQTTQLGTYQNPPDLQANTWTLIRFQEVADKDSVKWLFRKDGCMHCTDAACVKVCPSGALYHTSYGTVGINHSRCIGCKECVSACPFDIPRYDSGTDKVYKCDLCVGRIRGNQLPACVLSCPTGALTIGPKDKMITKAYARAKQLGGDANVYGDKFVGGTHVRYVLAEKPEVYDELPTSPSVPIAAILWKDILKPLSLFAAGGVIAGSFLHYIIHGPKLPDEEKNTKEGGE